MLFFSFFMLTLVWSCEKDISISSLCGFEQDEFYDAEIFGDDYLDIYGKWELLLVSGGFAGSGQDFPPESYLQIVEYGTYGFFEGDSIFSCGKIVIPERDDTRFLVEFENAYFGDNEKYIQFEGPDKLTLEAPCCDLFSYHYKRVE